MPHNMEFKTNKIVPMMMSSPYHTLKVTIYCLMVMCVVGK